jgi:hypothetical protein
MSVLVSLQTHLLDTWPRIEIFSQMPCDEVFYLDAEGETRLAADDSSREHAFQPASEWCCIVRRVANTTMSYAETMPATDFCKLRVTAGDQHSPRVQWSLFDDFLEKGVIRRARLQSMFVARAGDLQTARECCTRAERKELPLTT